MKKTTLITALIVTVGLTAAAPSSQSFFGDGFFEEDGFDDSFFDDDSGEEDDFFDDDSFFGDDTFFSDEEDSENSDSQNETGYTVSQGNQSFEVEALSGDVPVEEFYGFELPSEYDHENQGLNGASYPEDGSYYESTGTKDLQRDETSITFLYDGPEGLSLVVVHDKNEGNGGSASWTFREMPEGQWVVKDDLYLEEDGDKASTNYDNWNVSQNPQTVDWTWGSAGTDGGVYRGLGDSFNFTIEPRFNEDAELWQQHYNGTIEEWQFLSGDIEDPERKSLDMEENLVISSE